MLKAVGFGTGNLLVAWGLAGLLGSQLHYPPEIPLRLHPLPPALVMATIFSLLALPLMRLKPGLRFVALLLAIALSTAAAGAFCFPLDRADGALLALVIAQHSPLVALAGAAWALVWSFVVFRPLKPPPERAPAPPREELPISDQWSGSER
ncbi:MAG: hypothetical protein J0I12_30955 [Candidatus Eremiobacteraeota bacterium]|nr:hypothetical protein [Candidatus Eremiobacteraeota bacterium]